MQFKIGDFVRFIDEKREGYITQILDDSTFGVTDTDGFEVPVAKSNLTHVHQQQENTTKASPVATAKLPEPFFDEGLFLAVYEGNTQNAVVHLQLINRSTYQVLASLNTEKAGQTRGHFAALLAPKSSQQVFTANLAELDLWPKFVFQALYSYADIAPAKAPLHLHKKFRSKDFSGSKQKVAELNQYAWLFRLDEAELKIDPQSLKESFYSTKTEKAQVQKPKDELDLHIEKLRDDYLLLSPKAILDQQLQAFETALAAALVHQMPEITFIHGVGNGTLKEQLYRVLSKHPAVQTFMDARKEKFGYGATKVILKS